MVALERETVAALSWNEIRSRAYAFVDEWQGEGRERAEKDSFWNDFFNIFGISRRRVAVFEQLAQRHSTGNTGFMDVFWPGYLAAEHKSAGANLAAAMDQALDYMPSIPDEHLPQLVVVCDFGRFVVRDLASGQSTRFTLADLPAHIELFGLLAGYREGGRHEDEEEVNLAATELLASFHDTLLDAGYDEHALRELLVRVMFLLFADDTGVWERGLFHDLLLLRTRVDGSDLGSTLAFLFQILNTSPTRRSPDLDEMLARFTYINGNLFAGVLPIAATNRLMRERLLAASKFDWSAISPAVFGSMFQNVMTPKERRSLGAHYTTEGNILKVIGPLFLDDLRAELEYAGSALPALNAFRDKLTGLTWLDPAAGCGNFLIISYREMRRLELDCLLRIRSASGELTRRGVGRKRIAGEGQLGMDVSLEAQLHVGQFYGIEYEEFPARIAGAAMYLIDHLENLRLSAALGRYVMRFPITDSATIVQGNACRLDWNEVLPGERCSYLLGNPPFRGRQFRTVEQQDDMSIAFGGARHVGVLDYVTAWYAKAAGYLGSNTRAALVSTNSIAQGEQAAVLWSALGGQVERTFAHRTFAWTSEARGKAHVHVVIVGFARPGVVAGPRRLFVYDNPKKPPTEERVVRINGYLADGPDVLITKANRPISPGVAEAVYGSMANDGGGLLVTAAQLPEFQADPVASRYLAPYIGGEEMLNSAPRWCLWLEDASPSDLRASPLLRERLEAVRAYRARSNRATTRAAAVTPSLFLERRRQSGRFLFVPFVSSERRNYLPTAFFEPPAVAAAPHWCLPGVTDAVFGVLSSALFTTWLRTVAGRLESRFRLSPGTVYNTFPFPDLDGAAGARVAAEARAVLAARAASPTATLAELYDPLAMPLALVSAHQALDRAVLSAYGAPRARSEQQQQALLFSRYVSLTRPRRE